MAWVESASPSFTARHESEHAEDAAAVLESLERTRDRLAGLFPETVGEVEIVLYSRPAMLDFAHPLLPLERMFTAPAARRYLAGSVGGQQIHVLAPGLLRARASNVPGSREMMELAPAALYARLVIRANCALLPPPATPGRVMRSWRWRWLVEGAPRFFAGQTEHARPAIARRLREGRAPAFPPKARDAALLGGTVLDLIARQEGIEAAVALSMRLHPDGARAALRYAFKGRPLEHTEGDWRAHLSRLAGSA